jgi:hypothetical protein
MGMPSFRDRPDDPDDAFRTWTLNNSSINLTQAGKAQQDDNTLPPIANNHIIAKHSP